MPTTATAHFFDPKDIGPDDYIAVLCPKRSDDPCYFNIPGEEETGVWLAKVTSVNHKNDICHIGGIFLWNPERNMTKPFISRPSVEFIEFEEKALVGVFDFEPDFRLTTSNVKAMKAYIKTLE